MILQDIAWAVTLYEKAVEKGIGQELTLWDEPYAV
jgi:ornithine cyclodeaminase/alanine dehydrogenase-like protein (mu-crystallin family)